MGLLTSVTSLASTASNAGSFLADTGKNALKWIGIDLSEKQKTIENTQTEASKNVTGKDMRGLQTVGRHLSNTRSFDMDRGDFHWKESLLAESNQSFQSQINKLIIYEFQPYEVTTIGQIWLTLTKIAKSGSGSFEKRLKSGLKQALAPLGLATLSKTSNAENSFVLQEFGKFMKNNLIDVYSKNPELLHSKTLQCSTLTDGFQAIMRMFPFGNFLYSYTLPLLSQDGNIENFKLFSDNGGGWTAGSFSEDSDSNNKQKSTTPGAIPRTPNPDKTLKPARPAAGTTFYLINSLSEYTVRNYIFLHILTAGTYQMQLPLGVLQPPNVYHVEIPGKRELVWATMSVSVEEYGKYKMDQYAQAKIKQQLNQFNTEEKAPLKLLFPQAWKLTITFTDLTPNTFNAYEHYLKYGSCLSTLKKNASEFTWQTLQKNFKQLQSDLKSSK